MFAGADDLHRDPVLIECPSFCPFLQDSVYCVQCVFLQIAPPSTVCTRKEIIIPYARKRTHFTYRKEQGEIPVKWSDSTNRQLYSGGEAYGSQLLS